MAKEKKSRIQKFINYTKEAFFWPVHLVGMAIITALGVLGVALLGSEPLFDPAAIVLIAGGAELMWLSAITNNPRFIRAINAKYQKDIDAFYKTKTLVEYYNAMSQESQQRFDKLRKQVRAIRDNYKKLSSSVPELINRFLAKLNSIESSYARLLYFKDKFPQLEGEEGMQKTVMEIDKLNQEMKTAKGKLRMAKEKRLRLLQKRMDNYYKVNENRKVIEEQLQTIEDMVDYIREQPMTMQNTEREDIMIDNLLFETEQTQESLEEIESLMQSEFYPAVDLSNDIEEYGGSTQIRE
ncbi:MAG: hypothetical protein AAGI38_10050 [Bacteroidota bacterium]